MAIAVVSSLPHLMPSASPGDVGSSALSTGNNSGTDFAKILFGLPEARGLPAEETTLAEEKGTALSGGLADDNASLLATLEVTFAPLNFPPLNKDRSPEPEPQLTESGDSTSVDATGAGGIVLDGLLPTVAPPATSAIALASPVDGGNGKAAKLAAAPLVLPLARQAIADSNGLTPVVPVAEVASTDPAFAVSQPARIADASLQPFDRSFLAPDDNPQPLAARPSPTEPSTPVMAFHTTPVAARQSPETQHLARPLDDTAWSTDFGNKLVWFANNDRQAAQLTLNPPQLGSIAVSLQLDKQTASAHFVAASAEVRTAIESALPRLREMLASTGVELGQVSVGSESFRQPSGDPRQTADPPHSTGDRAILGSGLVGGLPGATLARHGNSLVDTFA